jgi:VIT1/CCC1 family predicted Fe2+/Mn2+ transporter
VRPPRPRPASTSQPSTTPPVALFAVGVYKATALVGEWHRSGLQMVLIGLGAALAGFVVGRLFGVSGG